MGGQEIIDIRPTTGRSAAAGAAEAYRAHRMRAASQAMRAGRPISVDDQLVLMTQLIGLADDLVAAVLEQ